MLSRHLAISVSSLLLAIAAMANPSLLELFPPSTAPFATGKTTVTESYSPSPNTWGAGLDERLVFHAEVVHQQDAHSSYALRLGQGGQIYSLRGPFGESVPPSFRQPDVERSPWNDEVWQYVAVCSRLNGLDAWQRRNSLPPATLDAIKASGYATTYFVHNSGAYLPPTSKRQILNCPLLAAGYHPESRAYRMVNLGLVPQLKTIHRSPLLYYLQVRDLNDGVVELTWILHNFSLDPSLVFDYHNAPWGGTRISSLPHRYLSKPDGKAKPRSEWRPEMREHLIVKASDTGGWSLSSAGDSADSPSLALVFGRDRHLPQMRQAKRDGKEAVQYSDSVYRDWTASPFTRKAIAKKPPTAHRNYDVVEFAPRLSLSPGDTIWYRSYLVVNRRDRAVALANKLVPHVDYGRLVLPEKPTWLPPAKALPNASLLANPAPDRLPVFLLENQKTGQRIVSTDPYVFVAQKALNWPIPADHPQHDYLSSAIGYDLDQHNTKWLGLLGFAYKEKPNDQAVLLSTLVDPSRFPKPTRFHRDVWVLPAQPNR